jgi:hypothetical protein
MSKEMNALDAMLAQYEKNNAPRFNSEAKQYDLKNYFNTFLKEGVKSGTKTVRILPPSSGTSPFVEIHAHKFQVDGEWKTFACLKHERGEACPFCEAREALLATGEEKDKELAKKYNARKMYVVKVIDRDNEEEGVKFWRFNHDYRKEGIYDKIHGVLTAIKKDVTNADTGRDLSISINRNQNNVPVVSAISHLDPSPLTEDAEQRDAWLSDARTWEDVYSVRTYDYLEIIVKGDVPVWDKDAKKFVGKSEAKAVDTTEAEITMGVENVKANIKTAVKMEIEAPKEEEAEAQMEEDCDDLPF